MPRIHMPDGTILEAPYDIPRDQLRAWADAEMAKRKYKPTAHQLAVGGPAAMQTPPDESMGPEAWSTAAGVASMFTPGAIPVAARGAARVLGGAARFLMHPATVGAVGTGTSLAAGQSVPSAISHGLTLGLLGRAGRLSRAGQKFDQALRKSTERFGRPAARAAGEAVNVPGRSMTGSTIPRGSVTQPRVSVRTAGSMDPAKQGPAKASGPVTPRSTPAGGSKPSPSTPAPAADDVGAYIERSVRDTGMSKRQIIDAVRIRYGATPEQARTAVDAIFGLKGLTRQ